MNEFGVLLVRKHGHIVDGTFTYASDRLPELDDEIELRHEVVDSLRAKVTGLEKAKSLPIRATEVGAGRLSERWPGPLQNGGPGCERRGQRLRSTGTETSRRVEIPPSRFSPCLRARMNSTSSCCFGVAG